MRIGLFTDTYRPSINGIVFVVESVKRELEAQGHEVYIFCPARSIRRTKHSRIFKEDDRVIRFPSVKGAFYEDYDTSLFFPPRVLRQIRELDLDIIHFFDPGQVGLMAVYAAYKTDTPLVAQHSTDLREYVEHYRDTLLLPGLLTLIAFLPVVVKLNGRDLKEIMKLYRPRRGSVAWNIDIVERMVTLIYSKCDAVIALSRKSQKQLESWQYADHYTYEVSLLPNGVNALKKPTAKQLAAFQETWGIEKNDEVVGFVGRLGSEKNLVLLLKAFEKVAKQRPKAKLLFVGDFEFREVLEELANKSKARERIIFTGALPRETLGRVYASMKLFVFPSLTDTQGWAVHEAALTGLPLILIDRDLSEVMEDGINGYFAKNQVGDLADRMLDILKSPKKQRDFGMESKKLARRFTEKRQVSKLVRLYERAIDRHYQ
ncbi:MAG TPA: glycosyltransferase [Candidatus Saccharimonadales bacterium]|nr:glycosyltransferase [Candidatus Saccharimonadales bacterium]